MTREEECCRITEEIRQHTGHPLPAARELAEWWVNGGRYGKEDMAEVVYEGPDRPYPCGEDCCGWTCPLTVAIHGPKGSWITYRRV
jgi:hypothetical protein